LRLREIAREGEDVLDPERVQVLERLPKGLAVSIDARQVDVGREPARPRRGAHAQRVVAQGAARIAGDASRHDVG
jgi:hypothetical protein